MNQQHTSLVQPSSSSNNMMNVSNTLHQMDDDEDFLFLSSSSQHQQHHQIPLSREFSSIITNRRNSTVVDDPSHPSSSHHHPSMMNSISSSLSSSSSLPSTKSQGVFLQQPNQPNQPNTVMDETSCLLIKSHSMNSYSHHPNNNHHPMTTTTNHTNNNHTTTTHTTATTTTTNHFHYHPSHQTSHPSHSLNITTLLDDDHCGPLFAPSSQQQQHALNSGQHLNHNNLHSNSNQTQLLLSQVTSIRKWKWSFCLTSTVVIMMSISFSILLLYNLLFSQPYVYINQIQINQLPIIDRTVGFNIILNANNPSILSIDIYSILLNIKLFDSQKSVYYDIETPLSFTFQNITMIDSLSTSQPISFSSKIYIGNNPNFIQLLDLFARNIYIGIEVSGKIGMYVFGGVFYHSQPVKKTQQYLLTSGSVIGMGMGESGIG
ncbi:hypothetical protein C9374_003766 [Naegleria lovaniensis]|uniref:Uncharacterized protein n=1 Tax=Naegleria lovaniensis TaxID=51637 RepID=A0AA88H8C6_NAELO|nr:uncharacterized protein C9374_003766 [Naegleria lovaniensis]KAG2394002.1 hypothetical protein C9374_003766 [Naegleria lovaniensis]